MLPEIESLATIVVCEDDELTRDLLVENLEADRYRPLAAPTAADALRFCRYSQPDLMLLDLALPDAPGLDVLRRVRSGGGHAAEFDDGLPIIVISGRGADADRVRGLSEGADDYLVKPFHYPELLARIRNALARRGAARGGPIRIGPLVVDLQLRAEREGGGDGRCYTIDALAVDQRPLRTGGFEIEMELAVIGSGLVEIMQMREQLTKVDLL